MIKPNVILHDMYWDYQSQEHPYGKYLGEAGNSSYDLSQQTRWCRFGDEVLVVWRGNEAAIIPADCAVNFYRSGRKNLLELEDGVEYDAFLRPMYQFVKGLTNM